VLEDNAYDAAVGLASDEYQLSNAELEAIQRVRGSIRADRDGYLVTWLARSISAHAPRYYATGSRRWSGSGTSPGNQQPKIFAQVLIRKSTVRGQAVAPGAAQRSRVQAG